MCAQMNRQTLQLALCGGGGCGGIYGQIQYAYYNEYIDVKCSAVCNIHDCTVPEVIRCICHCNLRFHRWRVLSVLHPPLPGWQR